MKKNKKGVSVVIGYVLLIVFAISMSVLVYNWVRKIIPKEQIKCPEGVSLSITSLEKEQNKIVLAVLNRGLFSINGITIRLKEDSTICQIENIECEEKGFKQKVQIPDVIFLEGQLDPGVEIELNVSSSCSMSEIELVPKKIVENKWVVCGEGIVKEKIQ